MHVTRFAGNALLAGTVLGLVTMALHPSGADLLRDYEGVVLRNTIAHGLALVAVPLLLYGMHAFSEAFLGRSDAPVARLSFAVYACASVCVLIAGTASGLVAPAVAARLLEPDAEPSWRVLFSYTGIVNQAFATLYVVGLGLSLALWSLAAARQATLPRWVSGLGLILGGALVLVMLIGSPHLDVHTFGAIVLAQATWFLAVGVGMRGATGRA